MLAWWLVVGDQILVMVGLILVPAASTMKTGFGEQCSAQYNYNCTPIIFKPQRQILN